MEPFEIRTTPARLPALTIIYVVVLLPVLVYALWLGVDSTLLAARRMPDHPSQALIVIALLVAGYVLTWVFVRTYAPACQVVWCYLSRDRGREVVAYRLDESGWRHVVAGSDVLIPWTGMEVAVTDREDDHFNIRLTSDGPFAATRDPFSRQVRRTLRKEGGLSIRMTVSDPTEDELATAIAAQSRGRVSLAR